MLVQHTKQKYVNFLAKKWFSHFDRGDCDEKSFHIEQIIKSKTHNVIYF